MELFGSEFVFGWGVGSAWEVKVLPGFGFDSAGLFISSLYDLLAVSVNRVQMKKFEWSFL